MKKRLSFINNEHGFVLPHVLFVSTILFIYIFHQLYMYQNEMELTYLYLDQLKIETLFQRGNREMIEKNLTWTELQNDPLHHFEYPDGKVRVEFFTEGRSSEKGYFHFSIETEKDSTYLFVKTVDPP